VVFVKFAKRIILILFNVTVFLALIVRKELLQGPQRLREILLPLVIIFFWSVFNLTGFLPDHFIHILVPQKFMFMSLFVGLVLIITGWLICLIGVYNIRYSFGVFVQVRPLVVSGFYNFCRHPVYLGYIVTTAGLCFSWPTPFAIVSAVLYIWLTVLRSRIEEVRLLAYSPEYKIYMEKTPMFFPRFHRIRGN
jgi:protein-S-isoprenylcysteine O-methyltransferase Ste14